MIELVLLLSLLCEIPVRSASTLAYLINATSCIAGVPLESYMSYPLFVNKLDASGRK